jgi:hypothetical protein
MGKMGSYGGVKRATQDAVKNKQRNFEGENMRH